MKYTDLASRAEKALEGVTDVIARLRACANGIGSFKTNRGDFGLCDDAADLLSVLKAENEAIKEANENLGILSAEDVAVYQEAIARAEAAEADAAALRERVAERDEFRSCLATTSGKLMVAEARVAELTRERDAVEALDVIRKNGAEATAAAMILHIAETLGAKGKAVLTTGDDFGAQVLEYAAAIRKGATPDALEAHKTPPVYVCECGMTAPCMSDECKSPLRKGATP